MLLKAGWIDAGPRSSADRPGARRPTTSRRWRRSPEIAPSLRLGTRVLGVSRRGVDKLRTDGRETAPFVLRVRTPAGEEDEILARAVIDASGTSGVPNPARRGRDRRREGKPGCGTACSTGSRTCWGASAAALRRPARGGGRERPLGVEHPPRPRRAAGREPGDARSSGSSGARSAARVFGGGAADALPARGALGQQVRELLERGTVTLVVGRIAAVARTARGVTILDEAGATLAVVDEVVAVTGLRPDLAPLRELRLDLDPIMEAPRALAPLIDPNLHSCGTVPPHGVEELAQPETGFFVVGHEELRPGADLPHADRLRAGPVDRLRADRRHGGRSAGRADAAGDGRLQRAPSDAGIVAGAAADSGVVVLRRPGARGGGRLLRAGCRGQGQRTRWLRLRRRSSRRTPPAAEAAVGGGGPEAGTAAGRAAAADDRGARKGTASELLLRLGAMTRPRPDGADHAGALRLGDRRDPLRHRDGDVGHRLLRLPGVPPAHGAGPRGLAGGRDRRVLRGLGVSALAALPVGRWIDRHGARGS